MTGQDAGALRLLVLGASGGIGGELVEQAVARGHRVRALVRHGSAFAAPDCVEVVRGELLEPGVLDAAVRDVDAVLSAVGIRRRIQSNPFSRLVSPSDLVERSCRLLVPAMRGAGISRLVLCSAAGAGVTRPLLSFGTRLMVELTRVRHAYRDLDRAELLLGASGLDVRIVAPVTLRSGAARGGTQVAERYGMSATIRRADVAARMLDALAEPLPWGLLVEAIRG